MRMQRIAVAVGMILAGCTVSQPRIKPSDTAAPPQKPVPIETGSAVSVDEPVSYTYELLTPEQTKLVQVFDDTRRTYLTFDVQVPLGLLIFDESGRAMTFTVVRNKKEMTLNVEIAEDRSGSGERENL